ncbi:MAG: hypothetical protein FRX49_10196 [Trebouxia sp. A1-2]|nr:MAG: hypothetical protein FRX49_10196 [Trebouxia sp. A1-2]
MAKITYLVGGPLDWPIVLAGCSPEEVGHAFRLLELRQAYKDPIASFLLTKLAFEALQPTGWQADHQSSAAKFKPVDKKAQSHLVQQLLLTLSTR